VDDRAYVARKHGRGIVETVELVPVGGGSGSKRHSNRHASRISETLVGYLFRAGLMLKCENAAHPTHRIMG